MSLHNALLDAHENHDGHALIGLYEQAAMQSSDEDAIGFFLTHAYVFALECGDPRARGLQHRLVEMGRDVAG